MFLQNLRSETAFSHLSLEQNPYSTALMSSNVKLEDYSNYLQKLYGFVLGFETYVFPLLKNIDSDIELRKKRVLMQNDLQNLQIDLSTIPVVPKNYFELHYPDALNALGGLYVLEGSMLGGVMIKKHLFEILQEKVVGNTQYLTGYGSETGKVWKNFLNILSNSVKDAETEKIVINSAKNTFDLLNTWIATSA